VKSPPDGYTLLLASTTNTINATLYDKLNFNFIRDIAPVATISRNTHVMAVHPSMPAKTVPEFIAYSKANPGKINMASAGSGSTSHVSGEAQQASKLETRLLLSRSEGGTVARAGGNTCAPLSAHVGSLG
jgi:tripartite-type tricarboxylate transporter receptor subunit TctC